ncbi:MAG TPA: sulfotransferase domain-containing protein [Rhizomicrobium sp.]|nr:sulfotransferase domain-containing protein [Rhizomicrobium sp.]
MNGKLILVGSFPKSGNTWTRIVLERIRRGVDFPINELDERFQGLGRRLLFDSIYPVNAADLERDEIENMLPDMYRQVAAESAIPPFVKIHDNIRRTKAGEWLFPPDCVGAALYLTRHPFDVAVSSARHYGISLATAVEFLAEEAVPGMSPVLPEWLEQYFGTWSQNVTSWLDQAPYPLTVARYEDLLAEPVPHFLRFARAVGLETTAADVSRAVEASRFEQLQQDEIKHGFRERPDTSSLFFRSGRMRSWEGILDDSLRERLFRDHAEVMRRLGYTADGGTEPWSWEECRGTLR